jgi:hypothetical protein
MSAMDGFVIEPRPAARFGVGAIDQLPGVLRFNLPLRTDRLADVALALGAADALDDEVLTSTPRPPTGDDIGAILLASAG